MLPHKLIFIIAGGQIQDPAHLRGLISEKTPDGIICSDSGARYAHAIGITPTLIIGDLDSLSPGLLAGFCAQGVTVRRFSPRKDETDTELALEAAMDLQASEIWILGALGYRLDHTLANLSLLLKGARRDVRVKLIDEWCEVFLAAGKCTIEGEAGQTVSLLPFFGMASGVTLEGFEYPLDQGTMTMEAPYGISNRLLTGQATIAIDSGRLLVIRYFKKDVFPS